MLHAIFTHLALTLAAGDHAHLHPANADVYIESSDVQAALKAYEKAPVVQLMNDASVAKIGEAAKVMGVDLQELLKGALPVADATRPEDRYWPWSSATSLTLSLNDVDSAPATGVSTNERTSGWVTLDFKSAESATQVLAALGGTGGVTKVALQGDEPLELEGQRLPLTRYEAELFGTKMSAWFVQRDARLIGGLGRAQPNDLVERVAHPETSFVERHKLLVDDTHFKSVCGTAIVRAWSDLERVSMPAAATPTPVSTTTPTSTSPTPASPGATSPTAAVRGQGVETSLIDTFLPGFVPFVGQKGRYRLQLCGDRFVSESLTERIGPAKQLDELYGTGTIPISTARMIPKEAVGAWLMKMRPAQFEALLESTLARTQNLAANSPADQGPKISAALGDSAAMFMLPFAIGNLTSGDMIPNAMMAVELKDGVAFKAGLEALIERIKALDPKLTVENKPYHKLPMYTFSHPAGAAGAEAENSPEGGSGGFGAGLEASLRPTVVILADRVLIAPNRKSAQTEVRRIESNPTDVHALAVEGAIQRDAYEISTMDWGALVGKLYDAARGFLPMLNQGSDKTIDVNALPAASELFRFFKPSASYSTRIDGKTYTYSESSIGPETPLALGLLSVGMSGSARISPRSTDETKAIPGVAGADSNPSESAPVPRAETTEADATKAATVVVLRRVKTGLAIYRSQFGRVPDTLDELLKGTEAFPKGFLDGDAVPKDAWGHTLVFSAQEKGTKFTLRSLGANGVDDQGAGDDVTSP